MTDAGLAQLIAKCPKLHPDKVISLLKGDAFLASVADNRPALQQMDLDGCGAVSDGALSMLMERFPQLHPDKVVSVQKGDSFCAATAKQVCFEIARKDHTSQTCDRPQSTMSWCD